MSTVRPTAGILAAILLIVLLPAGYMGAYYATMPRRSLERQLRRAGIEIRARFGEYDFFWPAWRLERAIERAMENLATGS